MMETYVRSLGLYLLVTLSALVVLGANTTAMAAPQSQSEWVQQPHLEARLLSEFSTISRGHLYTLAVQLEPEAGWHTYWMNPGDSGLATQIQWQGPEGSYFDAIQWPIAEKFNIGPLSNYGFEGTTYLLTDFSIPQNYEGSEVTLTAQVDWLVCEEICIPGSAELSVTLAIGMPNPASENTAHFSTARAQLPELVAWPAQFDIQDRQVTIVVKSADAVAMASEAGFYGFVGATELVEHAETGQIDTADDMLVLRRTLNTYNSETPDSFALQLTHPNRSVELRVSSAQQPEAVDAAAPAAASTGDVSFGLVLIFAFLGGLILNLMPCVFPVLSLKAMAVANSHGNEKREALWYTAGVVVTFLVFAGLLLALRAAGQALGWGFQLQNPWLIAALVFLFVAIGLNLSGVFQMATRLMSVGQGIDTHTGAGAKKSFATGILAVIVASPCTAPFMGVALGYAITQPPAIALLVFAVLGLGLAAPFLLIGFIPAIARLLPKPGAWMDTFKQWMAFPMYLTTVWLLWVFGRQTGIDALTLLLIALVFLATALWWLGKLQLRSQPGLFSRILVWVFLLLTALTYYSALNMPSQPTASSNGTENGQVSGQNWQPWSADKLAELRANNETVFVNMTADWCITCLANERVALNVDATRTLFAENDIVYLKGDWTRQDPAITEYLAQYGRNGVPLYVLYVPGEAPKVLPQILTPAIVREQVLSQ